MNEKLARCFTMKTKNVVVSEFPSKEENEGIQERHLYLTTVLQKMRSIGFVPDKDLAAALTELSKEGIIAFHDFVMPILIDAVGEDENVKPFYRNFPEEVMRKDEYELYHNSVTYYFLAIGLEIEGRKAEEFINKEEEKERFPFTEKVNYKYLGFASEEDVEKEFIRTMSSKTTISSSDKEFAELFISTWDTNKVKDSVLQIELQNKENACILNGMLFSCMDCKNDTKAQFKALSKNIKTATDVLRLATYASTGNTDLNHNYKFKCFSRHEARILMALLESIPHPEEDIKRYKEKWKRLSKAIHSTNKAFSKFKKTNQIFSDLYNGKNIETFGTKTEKAIAENNYKGLVRLYGRRPGEYVRHLEKLASIGKVCGISNEQIVCDFENMLNGLKTETDEVSLAVLLQERDHLKSDVFGVYENSRDKNGNARLYVKENASPVLEDYNLRNALSNAIEKYYISRMSLKEPIGNVYIDSSAKKVNISLNSAADKNESFMNIATGSRIPLSKTALRFSVYWKNGKSGNRTDIDLHACFLNEDYNIVSSISFYNLKQDGLSAYHSGDVVDGKDGACEFIDLQLSPANRKELLKHNYRYIAITPTVFSGDTFGEITCNIAYQERDAKKLQEGRVYEEKAIENKIKISGSNRIVLSFLYDIKTHEVVVVDKPMVNTDVDMYSLIPLDSESSIKNLTKALIEKNRLNVADLFELQEKAGRCKLVNTAKEADVIVSFTRPKQMLDGQEFIDLKNPSVIQSEYLDSKARVTNILAKTFSTKSELYTKLQEKECLTTVEEKCLEELKKDEMFLCQVQELIQTK